MSVNTMMYQTLCARQACGNKMYVYGKDRSGTLPVVYCSKRCEGEAAYDRKFKKL